jgi:DNA-binding NarL/FixJ family response regulator
MIDNNADRSFTILICDDHQLFCQGLKEVIKQFLPNANFCIANNTIECLELLENRSIDVFICDIKIGNDDGLYFIKRNYALLQHKTIIILSGLYEKYLLRKAMHIGVNYFLQKEVGIQELLQAIYGEESTKLEYKFANETQIDPVEFLSKKEKEILKLIVAGLQSKEIADKLFISKTTVDTHRRNIHRKLNTTRSGELIRLVYEGIIPL